jgi:hypothetical protein
MSTIKLRAAVRATGVLLAVLSSTLSASASVCSSGGKLDLDICAGPSPSPPINKPEFEKPWQPSLPNPSPTVVTPQDSRGRTTYGPGIQWRF